jgi:hypothetical protein
MLFVSILQKNTRISYRIANIDKKYAQYESDVDAGWGRKTTIASAVNILPIFISNMKNIINIKNISKISYRAWFS